MAVTKLRKNRNKMTTKNTESRCERKLAVNKRNKRAQEILLMNIPQDIKDLLIAGIYKLQVKEDRLLEIKKNNNEYFDWDGNLILPNNK